MKTNTNIALYLQVKNWITKEIEANKFKAGDKIPSENEFVKMFGVSKTTINKALSELVFEGYLIRVQGKGTFVLENNRMSRTKSGQIGFTDEMKKRGKEVITKPIELQIVKDDYLYKIFNLPESAILYKYKRLRIIDGIVVAVQTSYVPNEYLGFMPGTSINDLKSYKLYDILMERGIKSSYAKESYQIEIIDNEEIQNIMDVDKGLPAFSVKRYSYLKNNSLLEYAESYLRWDYYKIDVELKN